MARISKPWRAMALVGMFALAACEAGADTAASEEIGIDTEPFAATHADTTEHMALGPVIESGLEHLVVMSGPTDENGLLGAGCTAEAEDLLPDGDWFGFVLEAHNHHLVVDLACVYGPDTDQFQAYAADADSSWSSHVVVNDVIVERSLRFGSSAQAYMAADDWQPRAVREVVDEAQANPESSPRGVWLRVEAGRLVAVVQPQTMGVAAD